MIRLADVVARLASECPSFASVQHALTSAGQDAYPAALIAPVRTGAEPSRGMNAHSQILQFTVGVFVLVDRKQDPAPSYALANLFDDLQGQVREALIGWTAPNAQMPFDYAGGELDRYRGDGPVTWRDDFTTRLLRNS